MISNDLEALRADVAVALTMPRRRRGQFLICAEPSSLTCLPVAATPARLTAASHASRKIDVDQPSLRWAERLAIAIRQDLWRRLRGRRGLVPVVGVELSEAEARLSVSLGWLDGAAPAPDARGMLATVLSDAAVRRNRQWADRVLSRQKRTD